MNELKPCPFCGEKVQIYYSSFTKAFFEKHIDFVNSTCILRLPTIIGRAENLKNAMEIWNRRTEK